MEDRFGKACVIAVGICLAAVPLLIWGSGAGYALLAALIAVFLLTFPRAGASRPGPAPAEEGVEEPDGWVNGDWDPRTIEAAKRRSEGIE